MTAAGKRPPLTRERIVSEALALADESGIDRVSMRALAQRLHVEAMSLYNHVADKDDLLGGMVDLVVSEIELPRAGRDWRKEMLRRAVSARRALQRHRWALPLIVSRGNPGPTMLRYVDATLGCLREAGFSYALADHAWSAIDSHIYGFTLLEQSFPFEPRDYQAAASSYLPALASGDHPHLHALAAMVAEGTHSGVNEFEFGFNLLLDALERLRP